MLAFIGDIHLGTKLNNIDYLKSLDMFLDLIKKHSEPCDAIFVVGDLFDHRLSIEEAKFASLFLINLVCNNCGRNGQTHVPVKIIHGTYSHDYDQMPIFLPMLQKIDNVDVFYTKDVCSGTLRNGMSVLYLPQQYGDVNYTEAFSKKYNIIVGHGAIASKIKSPCPTSHSDIVLPVETLGDISDICVFGHYHEYTDFGNNVYYTGSMLRFRYNEDTPKVFFLCDNHFKAETTLNPFALEYKTIEINDPEELREMVSKNIETPHRFIIHTDPEMLPTYHAIMNTNKKNQNLTYRVISETQQEPETIQPVSEVVSLSPIVEPIPALISYVEDRYHLDVSDEIHSYEEKINKERKE